jgi:hypothetical protein
MILITLFMLLGCEAKIKSNPNKNSYRFNSNISNRTNRTELKHRISLSNITVIINKNTTFNYTTKKTKNINNTIPEFNLTKNQAQKQNNTKNSEEINPAETTATTFLESKSSKKILQSLSQYPLGPSPNYSSDPELIFGSARNISCTRYTCQFPNFCTENNTICKCAWEFAEYELNKPSENGEANISYQGQAFCAYRKKNQLVYFLLELLLNLGAGHFYAGNYVLGGLKVGLIFVPCIAFCVMLCLGIAVADKLEAVFSLGFLFICLLSCGMSVWWLVDIILIGTRKYSDGNGVPLNPW